MAALTPREREVVQMLAQGKTQVQIARELFISVETVYIHARNARSKTGTSSTFELAVKAALAQK